MSANVIRGAELMGSLVRALELTRSPQAKALSGETARRYFKAEVIKRDTEAGILESVANALLELRYLELPDLAPVERISRAHVVAAGLHVLIHRWDAHLGFVRSLTAPVEHPELLLAFLRQLVIDLSLRWAAALTLSGRRLPPQGLPAWAAEDGWAAPLRDLKAAHSKGSGGDATWEKLREQLGFNTRKSLENWLYAQARPGETSITDLAELFAEADGAPPEHHLRSLRLHWGLASFAAGLAEQVGWEEVGDLAKTLVRFTREVHSSITESRLPRDQLVRALWKTIAFGFSDGSSLELVKLLLVREQHAGWAADLEGVISGPEKRLHWAARTVANEAQARAQARVEGLSDEVVDLALKLALRLGPAADVAMLEGLPPSLQADLLSNPQWVAYFIASKAQSASDAGDLCGAVDGFREAVSYAPANAELHFRLGAALGRLGLIDEAALELQISLQLEPSHRLALIEKGILFLNSGKTSAALEHLREVARALPDDPHALYHLAIAEIRSGLFTESLQTLERVLEKAPSHALALDLASQCAAEAGDHKKARAYAKRASPLGGRR